MNENEREVEALWRICHRLIKNHVLKRERIPDTLIDIRNHVKSIRNGTDLTDDGKKVDLIDWRENTYIKLDKKERSDPTNQSIDYILHQNPDGTVTRKPWTIEDKENYL